MQQSLEFQAQNILTSVMHQPLHGNFFWDQVIFVEEHDKLFVTIFDKFF